MLNNCTFQGRFAADPEMRTTQSGLTVASFRMAVDRPLPDFSGKRDEAVILLLRGTTRFPPVHRCRAALRTP